LLNEKQEKFAQKFVLSGNATQSAKDAGYSKTSAKVTGHKLVNNSKVLQRIEELKYELTTSV
jgi:phage terminase small subunit